MKTVQTSECGKIARTSFLKALARALLLSSLPQLPETTPNSISLLFSWEALILAYAGKKISCLVSELLINPLHLCVISNLPEKNPF